MPEKVKIDTEEQQELIAVDNDSAITRLVAEIGKIIGIVVHQAISGNEALTLINNNKGKIAGVISDVMMPDMRGDELAEKLHEAGYKIPIVLASGGIQGDSAEKIRANIRKLITEGVVLGLLSKPVDIKTYTQILTTLAKGGDDKKAKLVELLKPYSSELLK